MGSISVKLYKDFNFRKKYFLNEYELKTQYKAYLQKKGRDFLKYVSTDQDLIREFLHSKDGLYSGYNHGDFYTVIDILKEFSRRYLEGEDISSMRIENVMSLQHLENLNKQRK